mgnify:FL=1
MDKHSHPLFVWSKATGRKLGWLADQAGISHGSLTAYLNRRSPTPKPIRLAFEVITGGEVTSDQWPEAGES